MVGFYLLAEDFHCFLFEHVVGDIEVPQGFALVYCVSQGLAECPITSFRVFNSAREFYSIIPRVMKPPKNVPAQVEHSEGFGVRQPCHNMPSPLNIDLIPFQVNHFYKIMAL